MNKTARTTTLILTSVALLSAGCATKSAKGEGAKDGAKGGAVGGAVGGFLWGLFTGDPFGGAAKGAAVGAGAGAVMGGFRGAKTDKELKKNFGETNYEALIALAQKDYDKAKTLTAQTAEDPNRNYQYMSAWISALVARETLPIDQMDPYYQKLIDLDPAVETREDAKVEVRLAQRDLAQLRQQLNVQ